MWNLFKKEAKHKCDYKVLDSVNDKEPDGMWCTQVMLKCECGIGRIKTTSGKWSKVKTREWFK